MTKAYIQLTENFTRISPYELKHLSECMLCKIEEGFEEKLCGCTSHVKLTENHMKSAITDTMQEILLELRKRELQLQRMKLNKTKALVFAGRKLAA